MARCLKNVFGMGVKRLEELEAYQRSVSFKRQVYKVLADSDAARGDLRYRSQLCAAVSGVESCIVEGWHRHRAAEMAQFLRYARASAAEADMWLRDGVDRGYFTADSIAPVREQGRIAAATITALWKSLQPFIKR